MELVASFQIANVIRAPLPLLWRLVADTAGVSRRTFNSYFDGLQFGIAIGISEVTQFSTPISLCDLRSMWHGFHPPQGFRYLADVETSRLRMRIARRAA
jgi:predicted transcriptional regulator